MVTSNVALPRRAVPPSGHTATPPRGPTSVGPRLYLRTANARVTVTASRVPRSVGHAMYMPAGTVPLVCLWGPGMAQYLPSVV